MNDEQITLADGRKLAYTDLGHPDGTCLFFFHGAPTSRLRLVDWEDQFDDHGVRVISPDRPGYGRSSPQTGRSMSDWPRDVALLADNLGVDRFLVAGHSSGGPYAVACAALLPGRVKAGIVLAGVTDMAWEKAWDDQLGHEITIMSQPDVKSAIEWCKKRFGPQGAGFLDADSQNLPEPDIPFHNETSKEAMKEAFRQGIEGYARDIYLQGRPWPFDPGRISVPVEVVHGGQDTLVPVAHSRHTSELIPGSNLRLLSAHGHLSILSVLPEIAAELARD